MDTKKKELAGLFWCGKELRPKDDPERVLLHDFVIDDLGRVSPYGVYDLAANEAWVSGCTTDTAAFAVESSRRWWRTLGQPLYPDATRLLVTADTGGSNGSRLRLGAPEARGRDRARDRRVPLPARHRQVATKIEHRLFAPITQDWRGQPLVSHETVANLIAAATTRTGLWVRSELDAGDYRAGIRMSDTDMRTLYHQPDAFHGEWDYSLLPRQRLPLTEAVIS